MNARWLEDESTFALSRQGEKKGREPIIFDKRRSGSTCRQANGLDNIYDLAKLPPIIWKTVSVTVTPTSCTTRSFPFMHAPRVHQTCVCLPYSLRHTARLWKKWGNICVIFGTVLINNRGIEICNFVLVLFVKYCCGLSRWTRRWCGNSKSSFIQQTTKISLWASHALYA